MDINQFVTNILISGSHQYLRNLNECRHLETVLNFIEYYNSQLEFLKDKEYLCQHFVGNQNSLIEFLSWSEAIAERNGW